MFTPGDILLQSRSFDKNTIIDKFSDLIYDLHAQFKQEHLDRLVLSVGRDISDIDVSNSIIDGIVSSRCNLLKKMFSNLSLNEQFFILAHLNLDLISPKIEDPNPVFVSLINSFVRELIVVG